MAGSGAQVDGQPDPWREDDNARRYDAYAREFSLYQRTSCDLIALARPGREATVLDLACGTGATTRELLAVLGPAGKVVAVDQSAAMLATAAAAVTDDRVRWVGSAAEQVDQHVPGPVSHAVCNSAIWQTELAATVAAVRRVMAAGGTFAFNVGAGFLDDGPHAGAAADPPALQATMRAIAARDYGWAPPQTLPRMPSGLSQASISDHLRNAGFRVDQVEQFSYEVSPAEERAWLSVPVFTRRYLPGLPYPQRMRVLDAALSQLGGPPPSPSHWVAFAATALASAP